LYPVRDQERFMTRTVVGLTCFLFFSIAALAQSDFKCQRASAIVPPTTQQYGLAVH
jgi:hypothetical protein